MKRIISNPEYNNHLVNGVDSHKPTKVAPSSLFYNIPKTVKTARRIKTNQVLEVLDKQIGEPYFNDDGFILYNADCIEIFKKLISNKFFIDLTITSPPYNIGKKYESLIDTNKYVDWCTEWMNYIFNITKYNGSFWLNLGYFKVKEKGLCVPIPYLLWDKSKFYLLQEIVWSYGAGVSTKKRLSPRNEKWLFYIKDQNDYIFNLDDIRDPNVKYPNQKKNGKFRCNPLGKNPSDVWDLPKVTTGKNRSSKERTDHPAQFPLKVIDRIVKASSNELDIIVDPFAGSCSTGIAAIGLGRIFVGIELNQKYCDLSIQRYENFKKEKETRLNQIAMF